MRYLDKLLFIFAILPINRCGAYCGVHNAYRDIIVFNTVCNDLAEIMATQGGEAIIEWVI